MLSIDYSESARCALISWTAESEGLPWLSPLKNTFINGPYADSVRRIGSSEIEMPWWAFTAQSDDLLSIINAFGLKLGREIIVTSIAAEKLKVARERRIAYSSVSPTSILSASSVEESLASVNFARPLTEEQTRNVRLLASLPAAATFSVPGAGKTTEALATFLIRAEETDRLLVIAPKNAFSAWDEQLALCLPNISDKFVRLRNSDLIPQQLHADPRFMLIGYQQLARVRDIIADHVASRRVHVFLDESHRIKGLQNKSTEVVLSLAHLPVSKLVMSGTPMPQSTSDLVPQARFLFPEIPVNGETVIGLMTPIFVRTTKSELRLPEVTRVVRRIPMDPIQAQVYQLLKSEVARDATGALSDRSRSAFRRLGRSVTRMLQFTSNPALLARDMAFAHSNDLALALSEGKGPKLRFLLARVRQLVSEGKKVLVWTTFVENVEGIAFALQDIGAVFIHGGVDAGSESDEDTREGKIKLFHDDPSTRVMVANPAAASEGISLHKVCHNAIYLDRNFNAAQYLQSEDRIHRLGLKKGTETLIEILECENSVDEAVRHRLNFKIGRMADFLNDPGLAVSAELFDIDEDDEILGAGTLNEGDAQEILRTLGVLT